jgi:hypothetical protein
MPGEGSFKGVVKLKSEPIRKKPETSRVPPRRQEECFGLDRLEEILFITFRKFITVPAFVSASAIAQRLHESGQCLCHIVHEKRGLRIVVLQSSAGSR